MPDGTLDRARVVTYAKKFAEAVTKGMGGNILDFDPRASHGRLLTQIRDNVFQFSAAKNRAEIQALSAALLDEDGQLRNFAQFRAEAASILGEFQGNWLKTEYDNAVNASTMAARWREHEQTPNTILMYRTAGDARVRPEHKLLNGISKPVTDAFWNIYYPPNGWGCRCDVEAITSGRISPGGAPPGAIDGVPPMFRGNFAKDGLIFPPGHPYFITAPPIEPSTVQRWIN